MPTSDSASGSSNSDVFGVARGACRECRSCGEYLKFTSEYTRDGAATGKAPQLHPENDITLVSCSRCGCSPQAHEVNVVANEHAAGNAAFARGEYHRALAAYTRALALAPRQAVLFSNRAAVYLALRWYPQAELDAKAALALRPEWPKAQSRLLAAQQGRAGLQSNLTQRQQNGQKASDKAQQIVTGLHTVPAQEGEDQGTPWHCRNRAAAELRADGLLREIMALESRRDALLAEVARLEYQKAALSAPPSTDGAQLIRERIGIEGSAQLVGGSCCAQSNVQPGGRRSSSDDSGQAVGKALCAERSAQAGGEGCYFNNSGQAVGKACCAEPSAPCRGNAANRFLEAEGEGEECSQVTKHEGYAGRTESTPGLDEYGCTISLEGEAQGNCVDGQAKQHASSSVDTLAPEAEDTLAPEAEDTLAPEAAAVPEEGASVKDEQEKRQEAPMEAHAGSADSSSRYSGNRVHKSASTTVDSGMTLEIAPQKEKIDKCRWPFVREDSSWSSILPAEISQQSHLASQVGQPGIDRKANEEGPEGQRAPIAGQCGIDRTSDGGEAAEILIASREGQPGIGRLASRNNRPATQSSQPESSGNLPASQGSQPASQNSQPRSRICQPGYAGAAGYGEVADNDIVEDEEAEEGQKLMEEVDRLERLAEEARLSKSHAAALLGPGPSAAQRRAAAGKLPNAGLSARQLADLLKGGDSSSKAEGTSITTDAAERKRSTGCGRGQTDDRSAMGADERKREASLRAAVQAHRMAEEVDRIQRQQQVRLGRVQAAAERRRQAEADGDFVQLTHTDSLTQAQRGMCSDCTDCKGFGIWFRACDANSPEVMLHCSLCGCAADRHPVDPAWKRMDAAKAREAEVAAQRARRAQQAAAQYTTLAQAEARAYAVLGLGTGASGKTVRRAYKQLALKHHPDKHMANGGSPEDERQFINVTKAFSLLRDR